MYKPKCSPNAFRNAILRIQCGELTVLPLLEKHFTLTDEQRMWARAEHARVKNKQKGYAVTRASDNPVIVNDRKQKHF